MKKYIVETHIGNFETMAVSPKKAILNIKYRLFGKSGFVQTTYWTVKEA